jgi:hypothetical protein
MGSVPHWEKPPGVKEPWLAVWRLALKAMKEVGTWSAPMKPLLDEYVTALRVAREYRAIAEAGVQTIHHRAKDGEEAWDETLPAGIQRSMDTGIDHPHKGFDLADREMRRAMSLADMLGLTPKAQKALVEKAAEEPVEPSAFAAADRLARGHAPAKRRRVPHS